MNEGAAQVERDPNVEPRPGGSRDRGRRRTRRLARWVLLGSKGAEPTALRQFWWDLLPKRSPDWLVPRRSGRQKPEIDVEWISAGVARHPEALESTRRAHDRAMAGVAEVEGKADRIAVTAAGLLAISLTLGGFQLGRTRDDPSPNWLALGPVCAAIVCLAMCLVNALEAQRVALFLPQGAEPLWYPGPKLRALVRAEETARQYAQHARRWKTNALLQARAWMSRALVLLAIASVIAIFMATAPGEPGDAGTSTGGSKSTSTTSVTSTTAAGSSTTTAQPGPTTAPPPVSTTSVGSGTGPP